MRVEDSGMRVEDYKDPKFGCSEPFTVDCTDEERIANYKRFVRQGGFKFGGAYLDWIKKYFESRCQEEHNEVHDEIEGILEMERLGLTNLLPSIYFCRKWYKYDYEHEALCPCMWGSIQELAELRPERHDDEDAGITDPILGFCYITCPICHSLTAHSIHNGFEAEAFLEEHKGAEDSRSDEYKKQYAENLPKAHAIIDRYRAEAIEEAGK